MPALNNPAVRSKSALACTQEAFAFSRFACAATRLAFAFSKSALACSSAPFNSAGSISATTSPLCTRELKSTLSFAIVPDTCEPTCTVMTALIVPVASTTSSISPRSTLAVKCCTAPPRFRPNVANRTITTIKPARINHLFFVFIQFSGALARCSFVSQGLDRIEQRRFACRVIAEKYAHRYRKERRDRYGLERHLRLPMQGLSHQIRP